MSRRVQMYVFVALLVVLGFVLYRTIRPATSSVAGGYAADPVSGKFRPLDVQEPQLHLDLLENIRKMEYADPRRNIFADEPLPPPKPKYEQASEAASRVPQGPPPLEIPVKFFGYASEPKSGRRVAFFASGDDVLVLAQGDTFLNRYRLLSIDDNSAEVLDIPSGRRATLPITQPPGQMPN